MLDRRNTPHSDHGSDSYRMRQSPFSYFNKLPVGAFYRTPIEEHLRNLGANTVVVCECNFPNCPRATVYEASERELRVAFVAGATSGVYERGLRELEGIGVKLASVDELSEKLATEPSNA